jgi:hypothetical protein
MLLERHMSLVRDLEQELSEYRRRRPLSDTRGPELGPSIELVNDTHAAEQRMHSNS